MRKSIPVKNRPLHIFGNINTSEEVCRIALNQELKVVSRELDRYFSGRTIDDKEYLLRYLTVFPEICQSYTSKILKDPAALSVVKGDAAALYYTLIGNYDAAHVELEPLLVSQGNAEYVVSLLEWALTSSVKSKQRGEFYYKIVEEEPFQARRLENIFHSRGMDSHAKRISRRTIKWCHDNKDKASAAAYIYVSSDITVPLRDHFRVIQLNPFYAFRALITLWDRHFNCYEMDYTRVSPRWAYHLLLIGDDRVNEAELKSILYTDPAWALEYLCVSDECQKPETVKEWCIEIYKISKDHPLINHFLEWTKSIPTNPTQNC